MADNLQLNTGTGGKKAATDEVTYSGDTADVQLTRPVLVTGAEGSRTVVDLDSTHGLPTAPIAGENHLGSVGGNSVVVSSNFSRPANTTAYTVGDLVANNVTAGSVTPLSFAVARVNQGTGVIRRIRLSTSKTGLLGTEIFRVHLFKTSPTVANGDNGVFSANGIAAIALGYTDITLTNVYNDGSIGFASADVVFAAASASQTIYALIEVRSTYTPASGETFTVALEVLQD